MALNKNLLLAGAAVLLLSENGLAIAPPQSKQAAAPAEYHILPISTPWSEAGIIPPIINNVYASAGADYFIEPIPIIAIGGTAIVPEAERNTRFSNLAIGTIIDTVFGPAKIIGGEVSNSYTVRFMDQTAGTIFKTQITRVI